MRRKARPARQRIIDALVGLLYEKDLEDIPLKQLISRAGVGRSTFYYNFTNIDDVMDCLVEQFTLSCRRLFSAIEDGMPHRVMIADSEGGRANERYLQFFLEHRKEYQAIRKSRRYHEFRELYAQEMSNWCSTFEHVFTDEDGSTLTLPPDELDYVNMLLGQIMLTYIEVWADHGFDLEPHELSELMTRQIRLLGKRSVIRRD